jgi:chemotaxis protein CheX
LHREYINIFAISVTSVVEEMTGICLNKIVPPHEEYNLFRTKGLTSIINFSGKINGRLILDMDILLAEGFYNKIFDETSTGNNDENLLLLIIEMNNTIAGRAITKLNNQNNLNLRLSPAMVFSGNNPIVSIPIMDAYSFEMSCESGSIKVNIAIEGNVN